MRNKVLFTILFLVSFIGISQVEITWDDLAKVKFEEKFFPVYEEYFQYPYFSDSVKALDGQKITISGYFLDIDPKGKIYILSKGPMSSCFFCGIGGPETAIELQFKEKPKYMMDQIITLTGILKLNADDVMHFNYILTNIEDE